MGTERNTENAKAQMRKGILEFCTLLIIFKGQAYASDILEELKKAELLVVEGTLYPLLSRLKSSGFLNYTWSESPSGPPRKYYTLTDSGKKELEELHQTWQEFSSSINALIKRHYHAKND
jgi:PadR family transcriptional regulator PadR